VSIAPGATVGQNVKLKLGEGDNSLTVEGTIEGHLLYHGRDGNDAVQLSETAQVGGSVIAVLGDGENSLTHAGTIEGNLIVRSQNENDTVDVADGATVGGMTHIGVGEQVDCALRNMGGHGRELRNFGASGLGVRPLARLGLRAFRR
jgi:hypothetical protein